MMKFSPNGRSKPLLATLTQKRDLLTVLERIAQLGESLLPEGDAFNNAE
jgi:hypothetical protein